MKEQTLGVAVVGLGVGAAHARAYRALEGCRLRGVYDLDRSRAEAVAAAHGCAVPDSFEAILADPAVGLVSIASYDDAHAGQVAAALEAGKHVFVEKPMCRSLEELRAVKAAWAAQRGRVQLGCNLVLRAAPLYCWLRGAARDGCFGAPYAVDGEYLYGRLAKLTDGWRGELDAYSVMLGGGIHLVDLMLWVLGERPATVRASGNRICTEGTAFRANDFVTAVLGYPSGLVGRVTANFGCVHRHHHVVRLYGTDATFLYDDAGPRLHTSRDSRQPAAPVDRAPLPSDKGALLPGFVAAILSGDDLTAETQSFFDAHSVCLAADVALATQEVLEIDYV